MVAAQHGDGIFNPPLLLTDPLGAQLGDNGLTVYDGLANGYVLTFTNGLKVYLTGDTGPNVSYLTTSISGSTRSISVGEYEAPERWFPCSSRAPPDSITARR